MCLQVKVRFYKVALRSAEWRRGREGERRVKLSHCEKRCIAHMLDEDKDKNVFSSKALKNNRLPRCPLEGDRK